ncbi:MAG TPA: efflux RND transporter periplasmic adaptor subunit [Steroidobacteraceae bacterium]|nr:efflux RND transporter periplasmic adaptor subunit [Steroidobacteraceae bacterium]
MNALSLSRAQLAAIGLTLVLVAGAGGYWFASSRSGDHAAAAATDGRKVLYWHDPMVPNVRFDKPGKSPFMDMQLVPVYADDAGAESGVKISSNVSQNLGIRIGKVEKIPFDHALTAVGSVAFNENLLAVVPARVEGYATRLFVRAPLEAVRRGQPLAEIQAPAWLEAQQEYLALLDAQSEAARTLRNAASERLRVLGVPDATIRRIESERKTFPTTTISSPIDGVVSELGVREGAAFMPGAPLFRVNGLSTVWVNARIPEANVSQVTRGSKVTATATAWPGESFDGKVIALLPEVDAQTRTLTARVELSNQRLRLAPGMFVSLDFASAGNEPQLAVPSEALIATGERTVVIVVNQDGSYGVADVKTGGESGGKTSIIDGLIEGQPIVLSGQFLIDSEASLKSTVSRLGGASADMSKDDAMPSSTAVHSASGSITAIDDDTVTVSHGPVASLNWPAMVMAFTKPDAGTPASLKVGDHVEFTFKQVDTGFQIETISKEGEDHEGHAP